MSRSFSHGHNDCDDDNPRGASSSLQGNLKFVVVIGELHPVPTADLLNNAAISFLTSNTEIQDGTSEKKAKWCLSTIPHDAKECNFIHRVKDQAMKYFFVVGEPAPVPMDHLLVNAGWKQLRQLHVESMQEGGTTPYPRGQWCLDPNCPDVTNCTNLHPIAVVPNDRYITVIDEEEPVPVSELLLNRRVAFILSAANDSNTITQGRWCINKIPHDPLNCSFLHRRREKEAGRFVPVEGEMISASCLYPNSAVEYLLANPQNRGRWCGRRVLHASSECKYVHLALDEVQLDGHTDKTPTSHLRRTSALMYLMEHRGAVGRVCTAPEPHVVEQCRFIHFKDSSSHGSHLQIQAHGTGQNTRPSRHQVDHHQNDRQGDRHQGDRNQGDRHQGDRQGERHQGERYQGDRHQGDRNQGDRNQGDRNQGDRNQGDRNQGERYQGDRHQGDRYQGDRQGDRYQGDRQGDRHQGRQQHEVQSGRHSDSHSHQSYHSSRSNERGTHHNDDHNSGYMAKSHAPAHQAHQYDSRDARDDHKGGYYHSNGKGDYNNNNNMNSAQSRPNLGPDDVNVEGEAIHISSLCDNAAMLFLKAHRGSRGKWCWMLDNDNAETRQHDPFTCRFVHPK